MRGGAFDFFIAFMAFMDFMEFMDFMDFMAARAIFSNCEMEADKLKQS